MGYEMVRVCLLNCECSMGGHSWFIG